VNVDLAKELACADGRFKAIDAHELTYNVTPETADLMKMDNMLLTISLFITILLIALSTYILFRSRVSSSPSIYLVGPCGSGKTALWSYLQYGRIISTQTSQTINMATLKHASLEKSITLIDCPGHPRLAGLLHKSLTAYTPQGVIILVDAATIIKDLNTIANLVYSTLLALPRPSHVLIVANKSDLFTALPVGKVRELLETEITSLKKTRDEGIDEDEERTSLGGDVFKFDELESEGVEVEWTRGSIEGREVAGILEWISNRVS